MYMLKRPQFFQTTSGERHLLQQIKVGPAGLSAAIYAARPQLKVAIFGDFKQEFKWNERLPAVQGKGFGKKIIQHRMFSDPVDSWILALLSPYLNIFDNNLTLRR